MRVGLRRSSYSRLDTEEVVPFEDGRCHFFLPFVERH